MAKRTGAFKVNDAMKDKLGWVAAGAGLFIAATSVYSELTKFRFKGKVVLITGGSRGLGLVLARQLAEKGALVALCARSKDQLEKARHELDKMGAEVLALQVDLTDKNEVNRLVADVIRYFGRLDVLINNAGIIQVGPQETMTIKDYEEAMDTNFWAALYTMHASLPHFLKQGEGRIVNITSIGGKVAVPHLLPYTASKFALVGLSEGMHAELKSKNIHVTTVVPNLMVTGSPRNVTVKGNHEEEYAWFKIMDSSPLTSQRVEAAAHDIIKAVEYGESQAILTQTAKLATLVKGFAPKWVNGLMAMTNRFLPANVIGGDVAKFGHQAESPMSKGILGRPSDRAAVKHNEL